MLIDLERGGLLEAAFTLENALVVPDLLYEKELSQENGAYLKALGLAVVELTSEELVSTQQINSSAKRLSLVDCSAMVLARRTDHCLLAGDGLLRARCIEEKIACHGVLWLLDEMEVSNKVGAAQLCEGLTRIVAHRRCRLPKGETDRRLKAWCKG